MIMLQDIILIKSLVIHVKVTNIEYQRLLLLFYLCIEFFRRTAFQSLVNIYLFYILLK